MIHQYKLGGYNIVLDVCSGGVHVVDDVACDLIALLEGIFREGKVHFLMGGDSGMLAWQQAGKGAEIVAIHTLPESHGTGLGAALLTEALNQIGSQTVFLWAFEKNARARRFYEKHGFRWDGSRRVSEFDGAIEVRYVK